MRFPNHTYLIATDNYSMPLDDDQRKQLAELIKTLMSGMPREQTQEFLEILNSLFPTGYRYSDSDVDALRRIIQMTPTQMASIAPIEQEAIVGRHTFHSVRNAPRDVLPAWHEIDIEDEQLAAMAAWQPNAKLNVPSSDSAATP